MEQLLFGLETEYAISAVMADGETVPPDIVTSFALAQAARALPSLPDRGGNGLFLENGSRLYGDCGGHPELAIAECMHPSDAVRLVRAGDRLLARIADRTRQLDVPGGAVSVFRSNVDYDNPGATWGSHESYLFRLPLNDFEDDALVSHLVSRVVYAGAGGLAPESPGIAFTLSPRSASITCVRSPDSTCERGILNTRDEPLSRRYGRLHIICGESLCSDVALWLRLGTTALLVAMIDARLDPSQDVMVASPVEALGIWAVDPTRRLPATRKGGSTTLTALDVQRALLDAVAAQRTACFMPSWVDEVCEVWARMLDVLARGPHAAATTLDWAIKRALFTDYAERLGFPWREVERLTARLQAATAAAPAAFTSLRSQLCEIDVRFGQLHAPGIFETLDRAGALTHTAPGVDDDGIERAMTTPPPAGRARLRGDAIRRLAGQGRRYSCEWKGVYDDQTLQQIDLGDPFESVERWVPTRHD